jgi:TldD protein
MARLSAMCGMNRREFVRRTAGATLLVSAPQIWSCSTSAAQRAKSLGLDQRDFRNLADVALATAKKLGASYADMRVCRYANENLDAREERVESVSSSVNSGFGVRVIVDGTWGFASSNVVTKEQVESTTRLAVEIARANHSLQKQRIEIEKLPGYDDEWVMPMKRDPFDVPVEEKVQLLLGINAAAQKAGASFCRSSLTFVREEKFFASTYGALLRQVRVRTFPRFRVTVVDKASGRFDTRRSLAAPRGSGYEYVEECRLTEEAVVASEEAKQKQKAKSVEPGKKDLVLHPTNLWLTIHESVGHPTELDRALGFEANYAGTSFVTTEKLGRLRYGSERVNIVGDRTQKGGLSTVAYDDDGVKTKGAEFHIIRNGRFENYQMSVGLAQHIGRKRSNGCAFADSWDKFPIQRMPNISLQPGKKRVSIDDLFADIKDGIYIMGDSSFSIDQQRYNFQFTGQVFWEIKNGKLGQMLRDVAYQGNTVDFWNSLDALCGKEEYHLGGAMNCGKGQPGQIAPVSHGAVPARFRQVNILNTERSDIV